MLSRQFEAEDGTIRVEATDDRIRIDPDERDCVTLPVEDDVVIVEGSLPRWAQKALDQLGVQGVEYR